MVREGIKARVKIKEWNSLLCLLVCTKKLWMMKIYLNTAMLMFRSLLIVFRKRRTNIVNKQPWGMSEIGITFSLYMEMKMHAKAKTMAMKMTISVKSTVNEKGAW